MAVLLLVHHPADGRRANPTRLQRTATPAFRAGPTPSPPFPTSPLCSPSLRRSCCVPPPRRWSACCWTAARAVGSYPQTCQPSSRCCPHVLPGTCLPVPVPAVACACLRALRSCSGWCHAAAACRSFIGTTQFKCRIDRHAVASRVAPHTHTHCSGGPCTCLYPPALSPNPPAPRPPGPAAAYPAPHPPTPAGRVEAQGPVPRRRRRPGPGRH